MDKIFASSALSKRYETVFYSESQLVKGAVAVDGELSQEAVNGLRVPFAYLLGGLDALGMKHSTEVLDNTAGVLIGAKNFRPPSGPTHLGAVQFEFCYVLLLVEKGKFELNAAMRKCGSASLAGPSTWKWSTRGTEGHPEPWKFYATQVGRKFVLVGSSADEVSETKKILGDGRKGPTGLIQTNDIKTISQHATWGYRNISPDLNPIDPTYSSISGIENLIFFTDLKHGTGVFRLRSLNSESIRKLNEGLKLPSLRLVRDGVWETTVSLHGKGEKMGEQMFQIMSLFGFGVFL